MNGHMAREGKRCRCCGQPRPPWRATYHGGRGYCARCYKRWGDHGYPAAGPPPPGRAGLHAGSERSAAGRREDYAELRQLHGLTVLEAAVRLGIVRRTAYRYEAAIRAAATSTAGSDHVVRAA